MSSSSFLSFTRYLLLTSNFLPSLSLIHSIYVSFLPIQSILFMAHVQKPLPFILFLYDPSPVPLLLFFSFSFLNRRCSSCSSLPINFVPLPRPPQTCRDWLSFILLKVPILQWVWTYKINYLVGDIIAGITVAIMHIPQGQFKLN